MHGDDILIWQSWTSININSIHNFFSCHTFVSGWDTDCTKDHFTVNFKEQKGNWEITLYFYCSTFLTMQWHSAAFFRFHGFDFSSYATQFCRFYLCLEQHPQVTQSYNQLDWSIMELLRMTQVLFNNFFSSMACSVFTTYIFKELSSHKKKGFFLFHTCNVGRVLTFSI